MAKKLTDDVPQLAETDAEEVSGSSIDRLTAAIEKMVVLQMSRPQDPGSAGLMEKLTEALDRVSSNQLAGAQLIARTTREVHRPSNEVVPMRSSFHPRGNPALHPEGSSYQMPKLRCDCLVPRLEAVNDNMLTREEVELLNLLMEMPGTYVIKRIDDTKVKLSVKVEHGIDEVTPSKLLIIHDTSYNNEYFRLMPAMHSQFRQMLSQSTDPSILQRTREVLTMDEEEALIRVGKLSVAA